MARDDVRALGAVAAAAAVGAGAYFLLRPDLARAAETSPESPQGSGKPAVAKDAKAAPKIPPSGGKPHAAPSSTDAGHTLAGASLIMVPMTLESGLVVQVGALPVVNGDGQYPAVNALDASAFIKSRGLSLMTDMILDRMEKVGLYIPMQTGFYDTDHATGAKGMDSEGVIEERTRRVNLALKKAGWDGRQPVGNIGKPVIRHPKMDTLIPDPQGGPNIPAAVIRGWWLAPNAKTPVNSATVAHTIYYRDVSTVLYVVAEETSQGSLSDILAGSDWAKAAYEGPIPWAYYTPQGPQART